MHQNILILYTSNECFYKEYHDWYSLQLLGIMSCYIWQSHDGPAQLPMYRLLYNATIFEINFGVRQGSVLSPFLFAVYLDDLSKLFSV